MPFETETDALVTADWVKAHLDEMRADSPEYRLLEVDMEPEAYDEWHVPGATRIDWQEDLAGEMGSEMLSKEGFEALLGERGIGEDSTVVVYGDKANWFASHAYWMFSYYGHDDVRLMDGGRFKWEFEEYSTTQEVPTFTEQTYVADEPNDEIRVLKDEVIEAMEGDSEIIDVRNPQEYRGDSPPADIPDTTDVEGHIPGAKNVPWGEAVNADGTFKSREELEAVYGDVAEDDDKTVAYCRIGERSSHTWFVVHELLGGEAANYDGSWTDWSQDGNTPVEVVDEQGDHRVVGNGGD